MINSYHNIKAYITRYVKSDPRIPEKGFLWGQTKRVLDAMATSPVYPFFWVEDVTYMAQSYDGNLQINGVWELRISIKGNSVLGDIPQQEYWLNHTQEIMNDFIGFLMDEHQEGRIYFNLSRFQASMREVYEPDDNWGWSFAVQIGYDSSSWCGPSSADIYEVTAIRPVFDDEAEQISVEIEGSTFSQSWTESAASSLMLTNLTTGINAGSTDVTASTDGVFLYMKAKTLGASITYTLTFPGEHSWEQTFS